MESLIIGTVLFAIAVEFVTEFALNELNIRHVRDSWASRKIPELFRGKVADADYDRAVEYTLTKARFQRWSGVYSRALLLLVLFSGILPSLDQWTVTSVTPWTTLTEMTGLVFCFAVGAGFSLAALPVDLYSTFNIEGRFGFNRTTIGLYLSDKLKGFVLALMIGAPFLFAVLWLMRAMGQYWWLWAVGFIVLFQLLLVIIYPTFIAPWFNKFEPLKHGELRERILALAAQVGFETSGIYSMDGSKRSVHSNAYFTGLGKSKRIVLFDTLLEHMNIEQALAVLAHEMGHYKKKHIRRMLIVQAVFLFFGLYVLSVLVNFEPFFTAFGLQPSMHAALVLFSLLSGPFTFYLSPLINWLSRRHEYEADGFAAATLRTAKPMEDALINLTVKNLSNLSPHPWYSAYHYSHPSAVERIDAIRRWRSDENMEQEYS